MFIPIRFVRFLQSNSLSHASELLAIIYYIILEFLHILLVISLPVSYQLTLLFLDTIIRLHFSGCFVSLMLYNIYDSTCKLFFIICIVIYIFN